MKWLSNLLDPRPRAPCGQGNLYQVFLIQYSLNYFFWLQEYAARRFNRCQVKASPRWLEPSFTFCILDLRRSDVTRVLLLTSYDSPRAYSLGGVPAFSGESDHFWSARPKLGLMKGSKFRLRSGPVPRSGRTDSILT